MGNRHATHQLAEEKWRQVLSGAMDTVDPHTYDTWFARTRAAAYNDKTRELYISCPTNTHQYVLTHRHSKTLTTCAANANVANIHFLFRPGDFTC